MRSKLSGHAPKSHATLLPVQVAPVQTGYAAHRPAAAPLLRLDCVEPSEAFLQVFVHSLLPHHTLRAQGEDIEELSQHLQWCLYQSGDSKATDNKEPAANLVSGGGLNCILQYRPPRTRESRDTESWT